MFCLFLLNHTATTEIYTLSLHDALPIFEGATAKGRLSGSPAMSISTPSRPRLLRPGCWRAWSTSCRAPARSEEHTSELQSRPHLVCRLLLEKKKRKVP